MAPYNNDLGRNQIQSLEQILRKTFHPKTIVMLMW